VKKQGQPDNALEYTAGRKVILRAFAYGVADASTQSLAANWLRDLYKHHRIPHKALEAYEFYQRLMRGDVTDAKGQEVVLTWIHDLLDGTLSRDEKDAQMAIEDDDQPTGSEMSLANARQVGGAHYQKAIQHWDFVVSHDYGYLEGQVTKYVFRWRDKNGRQDLQKADHFLQKLIEVYDTDTQPIPLGQFLDDNNIQGDERELYIAMHAFHGTLDPMFLEVAQRAMKRLLASPARPLAHHPV
jgi:Protein of unknwon function (DUF3310)